MNITKLQVANLTAEQQEALATIEINRVKTRQRLSELASRHPRPWFAAVLPALFGGILFIAMIVNHPKYLLPFSVLAIATGLWLLIQFHAECLNRRLDSLIELLEMDKKETGHGI